MKKALPWILIVAALVVAMAAASWPELRFAKLDAGDFGSRFGGLLLFSLMIERTVEVFLTIWRGEESNKKEAEVQRLVSTGMPPTDPTLKTAQNNLLEYKAETLRWALPSGLTLGLVIAAFGVRVLDQFIALPTAGAPDRPSEKQIWWFHVADIVLTGALLAGGADPIHKLMDAFRKFMEASAARASGTTK